VNLSTVGRIVNLSTAAEKVRRGEGEFDEVVVGEKTKLVRKRSSSLLNRRCKKGKVQGKS
jgi:hypothetical protein